MIEIYTRDNFSSDSFNFRKESPHKLWLFPGGEVGVKLDIPAYLHGYTGPFIIVARINNSNDFFELANIKNALQEHFFKSGIKNQIDLVLPYIPYAQQDRVCDKGEAFSAKVFASLLNSLNFDRVVVADPHSGISSALINNAIVVSRFELIDQHQELRTNLNTGLLVAPDAGANKQTAELAKYFGHSSFIRGDKLRDLSTGEIIETVVYGDVSGRDITIVDDLCVGGRTFTELAKVLKTKGARKVNLFVTFGIFSNGVKTLFDNGIDKVFTTTAYRNSVPNDANENFLQVDIIPYLLNKLAV
jgi:ribose-phosphate pyrophosphokinase